MNIEIPDLSLVVLIGISGSGKSTFARRHFLPTQVISSDACRGMITDDENALHVNQETFDLLHTIATFRLKQGRVTVIDATNTQGQYRRSLVQLARAHHCLPVAIVLDLPVAVCRARNAERTDRTFGNHVLQTQHSQLRRGIRDLRREGFRHVWFLRSESEVGDATISTHPLWNNRRGDEGPFDIIGDVHGCFDELIQLLEKLGYGIGADGAWRHPEGRRLIFLGDLVDRGPKSPEVVDLVMKCVNAGLALAVPGNHDVKFVKAVRGKAVKRSHGLAESLEQFAAREEREPGFTTRAADFLDGLVSHYVLDRGRLVVAHAGLKEEMQGRASGAVREFCLYGATTGESDEFGLPERLDWAADYRGPATVVFGHTPVHEPRRLNGTINIDTGCVFGGALTAMRYPSGETVSVPARREYAAPVRPLIPDASMSAQQENDSLPRLSDIQGRRRFDTSLLSTIIIHEENNAAALEVMSRFAVDPRWLIHLPPTMSPCETSSLDGYLEHPAEAFAWYAARNVPQVICQEKHMGSRAVVVLARTPSDAATRFGIDTGGRGVIYTRTGRPFFQDPATEAGLLSLLDAALTSAGFWDELGTNWVCLDCEIMPWSAKAQSLLRDQYAATGSAAEAFTSSAAGYLARAASRFADPDLQSFLTANAERAEGVRKYRDAYRRYCWDVRSIADYRIAPFHILAREMDEFAIEPHPWHMAWAERLTAAAPDFIVPTKSMIVAPADEGSVAGGIAFWEELTAAGGEGMVVKPLDFVARNGDRLLQPALKCRGPEYLRIIYGPDYDSPENLNRLRKRGLQTKRSLALREFALGLESLRRFTKREPLRQIHECVFGILALESEPADPRL